MKLNFKRIVLISLFLLIITLGAVSASDMSDNLTVDDSNQDSTEITVDEGLGVNEENSVLSIQQLSDKDVDVDAPKDDDVKACENHEIVVSLPKDATGVITSSIDNYEEDWDVEANIAQIPFKFESIGLHNIDLFYSGDDTYAGKLIWSHTYNVTDFVMDVSWPDDIYYGKESTIYVDLPDDAEGKLSLNLNDNFYHTVPDSYGDFEFPIDNLKLGENKFTITYSNGNYHNLKVKGSFLAIPVIDVPYDAYYGQEYNVSLVLPSDAKGSLVVNFNGKTYTSKMNKGKASVSLPTNLNLDEYTITAHYDGSDYDVESAFYVVQLSPSVSFSKYMWEKASNKIVFKGPKSANGTLKIKIDSKAVQTVKLTNGKATIPLTNLTVGDHHFYMTYRDGNYYFSDYEDFEVRSENPTFSLKMDFINETRPNEPFEISTNIPGEGDGVLYVYVDGELASNVVSWGFADYARIDPSGLKLGEHTVELKYCNDSYYKDASATAKFKIVNVKILIPQSIVYGEDSEYIDVFISKKVTGNITIYIDGKRYKNVPVTPAYYGKDEYGYEYYINLGKMDMGSHTIKVKYSGDGTYYAKTKTVNTKVSYTIGLDDRDFIYGKDTLFSVFLPEDATGKITVKIDGKAFKKIIYDTEDGYRDIYLDISGYKKGKHTVEVTYPGDGRYGKLTVSGKFKVMYGIDACIFNEYKEAISYVSLKLPSTANGTLKVKLDDGKWSKKALKNGFANITLGYLKPGEHDIIAQYVGSDYKVAEIDDSFEVIPKFTYKECDLNKAGYVYLELPSDAKGNLLVYVDGALYKKSKLVNGSKKIVINMKDGAHALNVIYDGDDYPFSRFLNWYVPFLIEETPSYKGEKMSVTLPKDVKGKLNVTINNKVYSPKLVNGSATFTPDNLKIGENYLFINYLGGNYENYGDEMTFRVLPKVTVSNKDVPLTPIAGAMRSQYIKVSTSDYLVIDLGAKFNGEYVVVIDDNYYAKGSFAKGIANISLSKAKTGIQEIYVDYEYAKGKHEFINFFALIKDVPKMSVSVKNAYVGQTAVISISANKKLNDVVTVKVNKQSKDVKLVNGKGSLSVSDLKYGNNTIKVTFKGNDEFVKESVGKTVKATYIPKITAKNTAVLYTAKGKYTVKVYGKDGKIAKGVYVTFKIAGKQVAKVKTNSAGEASYVVTKVPGTYKISATALGKTVTKNLTVKKLVTLKSVTVKKSAKKLVLTATLKKVNGKYLKYKKVTFKFKGKTYTAKTNKYGVAKVTIKKAVLKKLKVGNKVNYQATYLKDTVKKSAKVKK